MASASTQLFFVLLHPPPPSPPTRTITVTPSTGLERRTQTKNQKGKAGGLHVPPFSITVLSFIKSYFP